MIIVILILCFMCFILLCVLFHGKDKQCKINCKCKNCNCKNKNYTEQYTEQYSDKNVMSVTQNPLSDEISMKILQTTKDNNDVLLTFLRDALENNKNFLKANRVINIVPSSLDFRSKFYRNNISQLCCNLILISYDISKISYQRDTKPVLDSLNNNFNRLGVLPRADIKKILVYTCISNYAKYNSYGGYIIEYTSIDNIKSAFIVLRGTSFLCELYIDALQLLAKPMWTTNVNVSVHTGFNNAYSVYSNVDVPTLRDQIRSYLDTKPNIQNLYITGHSLGASLCSIMMADLAINYPSIRLISKCYAVATPYTGNSAFVNLITTTSSRITPPPITPTYTGFFNIGNISDPVFIFILPFYQRIPVQLFCFSEIAFNPHSIALYMRNIIRNTQWENCAQTTRSCGLTC